MDEARVTLQRDCTSSNCSFVNIVIVVLFIVFVRVVIFFFLFIFLIIFFVDILVFVVFILVLIDCCKQGGGERLGPNHLSPKK